MKKLLFPAALAAALLFAATPSFADFDGDGIEPPFDCNDAEPSIHPGATEVVGDSIDQDCDAHETCFVDADGDHYRLTSTLMSTDSDCVDFGEGRVSDPTGDCDDTDPDIHPGGTEVCDPGNVDEDCDGEADDLDSAAAGKTTWYADADSDSYGDGGAPVMACDSAPGRVADSGDCDDTDSGIHPEATEVCDPADEDEDCDGEADDFDIEATGKTTWYTDADADGYGDGGAPVMACDSAPDRTATSGDCDDADASISPGDPEICDAANEDEDCDGLADDLDADASGKSTWYEDADADGYGDGSIVGTQACDTPPGRVASAGDCDDTDAAISPGDPEICDAVGEDDDCDTATDCDDTDCSAAPSCTGTVEVFDHMECFKVKTTEKLKATLDLDPGTNAPFQLAEGCKIGKAAKICVPITRPVYVVDPSSSLSENPLYEGVGLEMESICYKVKCPADSPPTSAATVDLLDHFGTRTFEKMKVSEICAPAEIVP